MRTPELPAHLRAAVERVRADREHGASWLAREAASALAQASAPTSGDDRDDDERLAALHLAAHAFEAARPSMAALANTVARIWTASLAGAGETDSAPRTRLLTAHAAAEAQVRAWDDAAAAIYLHALPVLIGPLFTHSRSWTVEGTLLRYAAARRESGATLPMVCLTESHPGGEGVALARALTGAGWPVTLVADAACGMFVAQARAVLLGADSVRADGSLVNKVGTYPLALAAKRAGVPVYVLSETVKIAAPDFPLALEEMSPDELVADPIGGVTVHNPYFELTPADLIAGVITERGMLSREEIAEIAAAAARGLALLLGS